MFDVTIILQCYEPFGRLSLEFFECSLSPLFRVIPNPQKESEIYFFSSPLAHVGAFFAVKLEGTFDNAIHADASRKIKHDDSVRGLHS